jgi:hypothetical protein
MCVPQRLTCQSRCIRHGHHAVLWCCCRVMLRSLKPWRWSYILRPGNVMASQPGERFLRAWASSLMQTCSAFVPHRPGSTAGLACLTARAQFGKRADVALVRFQALNGATNLTSWRQDEVAGQRPRKSITLHSCICTE